MSRRRLIALVAAMVLLFAPAAAAANPTPPVGSVPAGDAVWGAFITGARYWGVDARTEIPPGCSSFALYEVPVMPYGIGAEASSVGPGDGDCWAALPSWHPVWGQLCVEASHELGHLLGNEHSPDPNNLMYETVAFGQVWDPPCSEVVLRAKLAAHPHSAKLRARLAAVAGWERG